MIIRLTLDRLEDLVGLFDAYRMFYKKESDNEFLLFKRLT